MTPDELAELRKYAVAAIPVEAHPWPKELPSAASAGPWHVNLDHARDGYIAKMHPQTTLKLLDEVERLRGMLEGQMA